METEEQEGNREGKLSDDATSEEDIKKKDEETSSDNNEKIEDKAEDKTEAKHQTQKESDESVVDDDLEEAIPVIDDFIDDDEDIPFSPLAKTVVFLLILGLIVGGAWWIFAPDAAPIDEQVDNEDLKIIDEHSYFYKQYEFTRDAQNLWKVELYNPKEDVVYVVRLHYGPKDIFDFPVSGDINAFKEYTYNYLDTGDEHGATFITVDPNVNNENYSLTFVEFIRNLETGVDIKPYGSYTDEVEGSPRPVKRCKNTDEPVVYLKYASPGFVFVEDNCMVIQGEGADLLKGADKVLLTMYGVFD